MNERQTPRLFDFDIIIVVTDIGTKNKTYVYIYNLEGTLLSLASTT